MNVRSIGTNEKGLNPKVERLNGTVRDRETVMRGIDTSEAAQELMDAWMQRGFTTTIAENIHS